MNRDSHARPEITRSAIKPRLESAQRHSLWQFAPILSFMQLTIRPIPCQQDSRYREKGSLPTKNPDTSSVRKGSGVDCGCIFPLGIASSQSTPDPLAVTLPTAFNFPDVRTRANLGGETTRYQQKNPGSRQRPGFQKPIFGGQSSATKPLIGDFHVILSRG